MTAPRLRDVSPEPGFNGLVGEHSVMQTLFAQLTQLAPLDLSILIQGETGTGKELVAAALHRLSGRRGPYRSVNVAAFPEHLVEAELFGTTRGAYTGAVDRPGVIESTAGGSLHLDEAADLSRSVQAKLLRVLETGEVRRLGSQRDRTVRFRLLVSSQIPGRRLVTEDRWREDFFQRVAQFPIVVPPLSERCSDIPLLVNHFLGELGEPPLAAGSADVLAAYSWPGNVRELKHAVRRAVLESRFKDPAILSGEAILAAVERDRDEGSAFRRAQRRRGLRRTLREVEREHIEAVLAEMQGDVRRSAVVLGLSRSQLYRRLQTLGLAPPHRCRSTS